MQADGAPEQTEADYFGCESALVLEDCQSRFEEAWTRQSAQAAMLHPSLRSEEEQRLAEILLLTDNPAKQTRQKKAKVPRPEREATPDSQQRSSQQRSSQQRSSQQRHTQQHRD